MALSGRKHRGDGLLRLGTGEQHTQCQHAHAELRGRRGDVFGECLRSDGEQDRSEHQEYDGDDEVRHRPILADRATDHCGNLAGCNQ